MSNFSQKDPLFNLIRKASQQEQFLEVVSAEEARQKFESHLKLAPLGSEIVPLAASLTRILARDIIADVDVPPFDRSSIDGFALRASDTVGASDTLPRRFKLNCEVIACGYVPTIEVMPQTASTIATGGVIPRGADAVVMIEQTELVAEAETPVIELRRPVMAGQFVSYAGSDMARGETLLRKGTQISSREIGMLAACGCSSVEVWRRPKVAVLSTGDELVPPGMPLKQAGVYDSNGAIIAAAITEAGGESVAMGIVTDDAKLLEAEVKKACAEFDMVILSGGTSKGAGDISHRVLSRIGTPGILVHGVALKPGKPLCLAVSDEKPIAVLPGFPTSAIFTFHAFVAPVIRAYAGLPLEMRQTVLAHIPVRVPSELGRKEFVLVALVSQDDKVVAFPTMKGSGSVTSFSQADGFIEVDPLVSALEAGKTERVSLINPRARAPDLVIMGSHDIALDVVINALSDKGFSARVLAIGSQGGVSAAQRHECDIAPVHLIDPKTGNYNTHLVVPGLRIVQGWLRQQGLVFRQNDERFEGMTPADAIKIAISDPFCLMINRNAGAGTRVLIDKLLEGRRPQGYANQPKSHNAVAAAVAQGRADWGVAISSVAKLYGLGFLPITPEHYDFLLVEDRAERPAVKAFLAALNNRVVREHIRAAGMQFANG